jgi:hypothetical protein
MQGRGLDFEVSLEEDRNVKGSFPTPLLLRFGESSLLPF